VSQFEIFAAVRRRASRLRFPERRPAARPLFPGAKPLHGPATARFRTFRAALTSRWTSIWQCAHLLDTDRQVLLDRAVALRAFLRGVTRLDHREPATGPFSLVAQHRDHHARRNLEDLLVEPGLLPDVFAWTFDRALGLARGSMNLRRVCALAWVVQKWMQIVRFFVKLHPHRCRSVASANRVAKVHQPDEICRHPPRQPCAC